jgi:NhaP-type Na+/H+ or K+/H+ antiporter
MNDRAHLRSIIVVSVVLFSIVLAGAMLVIAVRANKNDAGTAQALATQIQTERVRNIRSSCESQNMRNRAAIKALGTLVAKLPPAERAKSGSAGIVLLINALAPVRNCDSVVREQSPSGTQ